MSRKRWRVTWADWVGETEVASYRWRWLARWHHRRWQRLLSHPERLHIRH